MLKKLYKHELISTGKVLIPVLVLAIIFSYINVFLIKNSLNLFINNQLLATLSVIFQSVSGFLIIFLVFIVFSYLSKRFKKNLIDNEGYLMFTLPVATWEHILVKLTVGTFWIISASLTTLLSIQIVVNANPFENINIFTELISSINELSLFLEIPAAFIVIRIILLVLLTSISWQFITYASHAISQLISGKRRLVYFVTSFLLTIVWFFAMFSPLVTYSKKLAISSVFSSSIDEKSVFFTSFAILIISNLIFSALAFFVTNYIFKNHLNLE